MKSFYVGFLRKCKQSHVATADTLLRELCAVGNIFVSEWNWDNFFPLSTRFDEFACTSNDQLHHFQSIFYAYSDLIYKIRFLLLQIDLIFVSLSPLGEYLGIESHTTINHTTRTRMVVVRWKKNEWTLHHTHKTPRNIWEQSFFCFTLKLFSV